MRLFRFNEEDTERFALTRDAGGGRLPRLGCVWRYAGDFDLRDELFGVGRAQITTQLLRKGYFLWPDDGG